MDFKDGELGILKRWCFKSAGFFCNNYHPPVSGMLVNEDVSIESGVLLWSSFALLRFVRLRSGYHCFNGGSLRTGS